MLSILDSDVTNSVKELEKDGYIQVVISGDFIICNWWNQTYCISSNKRPRCFLHCEVRRLLKGGG